VHRVPILALLDRYERAYPDEGSCVRRIRDLVRQHEDCFERTCLPGHITGSAWIVSSDRQRFLLTHHRKLDRWLQLGGHADGEAAVHEVALKEAREESGMTDFDWCGPVVDGVALPIDIDVHTIPPRASEPAHEHHDIRLLLVAQPEQELRISDESLALAWFGWNQLGSDLEEESLLRMARKARAQLGLEAAKMPW